MRAGKVALDHYFKLSRHVSSIVLFLALLRLLVNLPHLPAQTHWARVLPNLFDEGQTFLFGAGLARILPARRNLAVLGPDRILLFMVDDYFVDGGVFLFVQAHAPRLQLFGQFAGLIIIAPRRGTPQTRVPARECQKLCDRAVGS